MGSLKTNFLYSSILTTANYVFPLFTFPYISRVLGVNNVGVCNFIDSIVNYYILFSMLGISIVGIREIARCKNNSLELSKTFSSLFLLNTISTSIVLIIYICSIFLVPKFFEYKEIMYVGAFKLFFTYIAIEWCYQGLEEFKYITKRSLLVKSIFVISVFIFVKEKDDYLIYYLLLAGMTILNSIINFIYIRKFLHISFRKIEIRKYFKPVITMGFYSILTAMYTSFNVIYLGFVAGETQVGYYTTATKLYSVILGLFTAFTGVLLPRMSSLISENKIDEFRRLLGKTVNILLVFSIPIILYSLVMAPYIIKFIAGEGYEGAILPMRIVMPLIFIIGYEQILIIQALMPLREDRIVLRNSIIGASMGVLMNILLVGSFQSVGSAIVWVIAEIVVLFFAQVYLSRNKQLHFPIGEIIRNVMYNIPLFFMLIAFDKIYLYSDFLKLFYGALIMLAYTCILQIVILKNNLFILLLHKRKIDS